LESLNHGNFPNPVAVLDFEKLSNGPAELLDHPWKGKDQEDNCGHVRKTFFGGPLRSGPDASGKQGNPCPRPASEKYLAKHTAQPRPFLLFLSHLLPPIYLLYHTSSYLVKPLDQNKSATASDLIF